MTRSLYVMPRVATTYKGIPTQESKYRSTYASVESKSEYTYGDEPFVLVALTDVLPAVDSALTANADVFKLPDNLDTAIGTTTVRNQIRTTLEQNEFPGLWVETTTTYREIVRMIVSLCQFAQRYSGLVGGRWFSDTVHINQNFSQLTVEQQQGIESTAAWFGMNTTPITTAPTIRDALKNASDQYIALGFPLEIEGSI